MATITKVELELVIMFCKIMLNKVQAINSIGDVYAVIVLLAQYVKHLVYIDHGDTVSVGAKVLQDSGSIVIYERLLHLRNATEHPFNIHDIRNKTGALINSLNEYDLDSIPDDNVKRLCELLRSSVYLTQFRDAVVNLSDATRDGGAGKSSLGSLFSKATGDK